MHQSQSPPELHARCLQLQAENELLRSELEEFQFRERNLRKELEIMAQVREDRPQKQRPPREDHLSDDLDHARAQIQALVAERQQLEAANRNLQEKVNDLKYNNAELKSLNERTTQLHLKEIEIARKEAQNDTNPHLQDREKRTAREKEALEKKLESCAQIAKEMEEYYLNEIKKLKDALRGREEEVRALSRELEGVRTQRNSQGQWEKACAELREEYDLEVRQLRNKVKFLINKLEAMQDGNERAPTELLQSKLVQSNASIDSFRFTPNSSVSSNKEPLPQSTRRNTSALKGSQVLKGKGCVPLGERNY